MFALGEQVAETEPPPLPDKFGDIVFDDYECDLPLHNAFFEREEVDIGVSHLLRSIEFLVSVFPNASILVTLPGEYYGEDYVREIDEFENQIRSMFGLELAASSLYEGREVDLVFEPTFTDIEFMCNSKSHTNQRGRVLRTNDALQHLN